MCPEQMVVTDLSGTVVEGELRPSSDLLTHLELYRSFAGVGAVVHTHSPYATARAQAELDLPCYGTTHADSFYGAIPCTRHLTKQEVDQAYEANTGLVIAETFRHRKLDPRSVSMQAWSLLLGRQLQKSCGKCPYPGGNSPHGIDYDPVLPPGRASSPVSFG